MTRRDLVLALVLSIAGSASGARAQPETTGPYAVASWDAGSIAAAGSSIPTVVYYPTDAPAPGPIVMVVHGFLRNGSYHARTAEVLASRGLVAVVPDMPCGAGGCDHEANARQVEALSDWAAAQGATSGSRLAGRVDPSRRALVGHSWGGLGTFLAASGTSTFDAWVGLDPQEDRGAALAAAPGVTIPSLHLMAEVDGSCNGDWGADVYAATAAPRWRLTIDGSGHCDPEEPTDAACDFACRAGDRATTPIFRRYAVAFVTCALGMDASMEAWVGGASYDADVAAGRLVGVMAEGIDSLDCGGGAVDPPDGGASEPDASIADGGLTGLDAATGLDASSPRDASVPRDDGGGPADRDGAIAARDASTVSRDDAGPGASSSGGCGCRLAGEGSRGAPIPLLAIALALAIRRRRR